MIAMEALRPALSIPGQASLSTGVRCQRQSNLVSSYGTLLDTPYPVSVALVQRAELR